MFYSFQCTNLSPTQLIVFVNILLSDAIVNRIFLIYFQVEHYLYMDTPGFLVLILYSATLLNSIVLTENKQKGGL